MYTAVIRWNAIENNNMDSYARNTTALELEFLTEMCLVLIINIKRSDSYLGCECRGQSCSRESTTGYFCNCSP